MPTCYAYTCGTYCNGHWAGCHDYGCIDYAPGAVTHTVTDAEGVCTHQVTRMCNTVTNWNRWLEDPNCSNTSVYSGTSCTAVSYRAYAEATAGSEADAGKVSINRHVEDLRYAINEERRRRDAATGSSLGNYSWTIKASGTGDGIGDMDGVLIDNQVIQELVTAANTVGAGIYDVNPLDNSLIDAYHIDRIRRNIENVRKSCISNKVCNTVSICQCFCHCNCHYSDRRLKKNIRSL